MCLTNPSYFLQSALGGWDDGSTFGEGLSGAVAAAVAAAASQQPRSSATTAAQQQQLVSVIFHLQ